MTQGQDLGRRGDGCVGIAAEYPTVHERDLHAWLRVGPACKLTKVEAGAAKDMIAFQTIRARAEKRKGGAEALAKLMPPQPDPKAVANSATTASSRK